MPDQPTTPLPSARCGAMGHHGRCILTGGHDATIAHLYSTPATPVPGPEVTTLIIGPTRRILDEIYAERAAQDAKWGIQNHRDGTGHYPETVDADVARMACQSAAEGGYLDWLHIMREEVAEAFAESDPAKLRAELLQVAAVAAAWIEAIDRRPATARPDTTPETPDA